MSGGYVMWKGNGNKTHCPPGTTKQHYSFMPNKWVFVDNELDWKWYNWKEGTGSKDDPPMWAAKRRLSKKEDVESSAEYINKNRELVDEKDPYFKDAQALRGVAKKVRDLDEITRQYMGQTLPEYLKANKGILTKGGEE